MDSIELWLDVIGFNCGSREPRPAILGSYFLPSNWQEMAKKCKKIAAAGCKSAGAGYGTANG
jgi:hypothetical protein